MSFKKLAIAGGLTASLLASSAYASVIDRPFFQVLGVVVVWGGTDFDDNGGTGPNPVVSDFVLLTPTSGAGVDLIAGDDVYSVVTGSLTAINSEGTAVNGVTALTFDPVTGETSGGTFTDGGSIGVLDAADTLTAFGIDSATDVDGMVAQHESSFYVASNAAFDIHAQSSNVVATGDFLGTYNESNIAFSMGVTVDGDDGLAFGAVAQDPSTGGTGVVTTVDSLDDLTVQTKVFDGGQRTAAANGSIARQSVRFDSTYNLDSDTGTVGVQGYDLSMGVGTLQADVTYTIFVP